MSVMISNTTPVNYLVLIDHITVLRDLYERVIISQAVLGELQHEGTPAQVKHGWLPIPHGWKSEQSLASLILRLLFWMRANVKRSVGPGTPG